MAGLLVLTHGLPGAGKSSLTRWLVELYPDAVTVAERDELRTILLPKDYHLKGHNDQSEALVTEAQHRLIRDALSKDRAVVVSDTNLNEYRIRPLVEIARSFEAPVLHGHLDFTIEECRRRNEARAFLGGRLVPNDIIDDMAVYGYSNGRIKHFSIRPTGLGLGDFEVLIEDRHGGELTLDQEKELIVNAMDSMLEEQSSDPLQSAIPLLPENSTPDSI